MSYRTGSGGLSAASCHARGANFWPRRSRTASRTRRIKVALLAAVMLTNTLTVGATSLTATGGVCCRNQRHDTAREIGPSTGDRIDRRLPLRKTWSYTRPMQRGLGFVAATSRRTLDTPERSHRVNDVNELPSGQRSIQKRARTTAFRMDLGEPDGMVRTILSPTSDPTATGVALDPAQEACVLLDPETPAILLTAGAGTGKTQTLAARLARLLGVEPRRPDLTLKDDDLSRRRALERDTGWATARLGHRGSGAHGFAAHAATPESVLVLSFTHQGAQDVRERAMAAGLPRAHADRIWAATFHSFAASVLTQNRHLLWSRDAAAERFKPPASLDIIGAADQAKLLERLLATHTDRSLHKSDGTPSAGERFRGSSSVDEGLGGSWGMPPTDKARDAAVARRRSKYMTKAKTVLSRITFWKEQGLSPGDVHDGKAAISDETDRAADRVYASYQETLRSRHQVDFGDLCMMATELFMQHPEVLERYRWRLRHVLVDEYQDTSPAQQTLLKALVSGVPSDSNAAERSSAGTSTDTLPSPHHPNAHVELPVEEEARRLRRETGGKLSGHPGLGVSLFCAGDEDQHIYRWRGTTVDHLHSFEEDFPGAVRCKLVETHRLPVHLLRSATGLMRAGGLVPLLNKRMRTKSNTGAVVCAQGLWNSREEGKWIAVEARKMHRDQGISYKDMAVIARTAYNTRELEESLVARGVPYNVEGGSSFFSRPEVQAPIALLALCLNPQDDAAFRQFVSLRSKTSLLQWATPATMRSVAEVAATEGVSHAEAVRLKVNRGQFDSDDASSFIYNLRRWSSLLMGWSKLHEVERGAVVWRIFWEGGFLPPQFDIILPSIGGVGTGGDGGSLGPGTKMSKDQESVGQLATAASRCDHVGRFLLKAARAREEALRKQGGKGRSGRGGRWEGTTGAAEHRSPHLSEDALEMMTMHQAKGKEFKVVFLTGWDEGSFPLLPSNANGDHGVESLARLQDERRLGYVALTRASENAIITFSKTRRVKDAWISSAGPSRFLMDMPEEFLTVLPDSLGRTLNDYPGLSGSHTLAFKGLVEAGRIRHNRPVLPSASELRAYESSPYAHQTDVDPLPAGCTILNRNLNIASADATRVTRAVPSRPKPRNAAMSKLDEIKTRVVTGTRVSCVDDERPGAGTKLVMEIAEGDGSAREFAPAPDPTTPVSLGTGASLPPRKSETGEETPPNREPRVEPQRSEAEDTPSLSADTSSPSSGAKGGGQDDAGDGRPVPAKARSAGSPQRSRKERGATARKGQATQAAPALRPWVAAGAKAVGVSNQVRYNPPPKFGSGRGRKAKKLLDASDICADEPIGHEEILALVTDPATQQISLKNYLRAVLAIQHGCLWGSIPVWWPDDSRPKKAAALAVARAVARGEMTESDATGMVAISLGTALDLATYIIVLIKTKNGDS